MRNGSSPRFIGRLRVYPETAIVFFDGKKVNLTMTEYKALLLLSSRPGNDISYEELVETLWGKYEDGKKKELYVIITNLRKKLSKFPFGDPLERSYIQNVRQYGYKLVNQN